MTTKLRLALVIMLTSLGSLLAVPAQATDIYHEFPWDVPAGRLLQNHHQDIVGRLLSGEIVAGDVRIDECRPVDDFTAGFRFSFHNKAKTAGAVPGMTCDADTGELYLGMLSNVRDGHAIKKSGTAYDLLAGRVGETIPFSLQLLDNRVYMTLGNAAADYDLSFTPVGAHFYGFCSEGLARFIEGEAGV